jgi:hypothetical protein
MLLTMMIMLAIASTLVEMMFAVNIPAWRRAARQYKWFNMTISIFLSFIMGAAFGAAGVIALGAAMVSTVLSIPGYEFLYWNYDSPHAQRYPGGLLKHSMKKWSTVFKDFFKIVYQILRVITAPIWLTRAAFVKYNQFKSRRATATV